MNKFGKSKDFYYQPSLSYRILKLIGWITLTLSQCAKIVPGVGGLIGTQMLAEALGPMAWLVKGCLP